MALTKKQNSITFFSYKATIFKKSLKLDLNFFPSDLEVQKLKLPIWVMVIYYVGTSIFLHPNGSFIIIIDP